MKHFKSFIKKEPLALPAFLIIIGLLTGYIVSHAFYSLMPDVITKWNDHYINVISNADLKSINLFTYILRDLIKEALIFFMLCLTILGIPYYAYIILRHSFQVSFLISVFIHIYASKGLFIAFCNYLPQAVLYLPASYLCIKYGFNLYMDVQSGIVKPSFKNSALFRKYGKNIMIIILLFTAGAVLEAFVGNMLVSWAVGVL